LKSALNIGAAAMTATLLAPPMAWATFFLSTNQYFGEPKGDGLIAMFMVFLWSIMITGAGILLIAVPLAFAFSRVFRGSAVSVFLLTASFGSVLACLLAREEGSVIDFTTLAALHIAFAALIFSGVGLYRTKRMAHA
jgi:hypothetical protein